jgi:hypothetical protein
MKKHFYSFRNYWIQDISFSTLLLFLIITIFISPLYISYDSKNGILLLNILLIFLFFSGIFSSLHRLWIFVNSLLLFSHIVLKVVRLYFDILDFYVLENTIATFNLLALVLVNFKLVFRDNCINFHRIIGAINIYLMIGLIGAYVFENIYLLTGFSIKGNFSLTSTDKDFIEYIYFSFASLTTVGFGDIYATHTASKLFAVFLSAFGMLYPAVVIARLVSLATIDQQKQNN